MLDFATIEWNLEPVFTTGPFIACAQRLFSWC
jgi:hypothetical protein